MSGTKISAMTDLSPLGTADVVPVVRAGANGKVTLSSKPVFLTTIGVGAATAAASGSGVTFPASQSASTDLNTLDDYVESVSWAPTLTASANCSVPVVSEGCYVKVGKMVYAHLLGTFTVTGSTAFLAFTFPLPFTEQGTMSFVGPATYGPNPNIGFVERTSAGVAKCQWPAGAVVDTGSRTYDLSFTYMAAA